MALCNTGSRSRRGKLAMTMVCRRAEMILRACERPSSTMPASGETTKRGRTASRPRLAAATNAKRRSNLQHAPTRCEPRTARGPGHCRNAPACERMGRRGRSLRMSSNAQPAQRCRKLESHPHAMPMARPTAWAPFATCGMMGVKQAKNQMIIIVTVDGCRYKPEAGSNLPRIQM